MASLNRWEGIGRLGQDIELRYFPDGTAVANFNIAVDDSYTDKQTGAKVEQTEWVRCAATGKTAEFLAAWLRKGARIFITGKLKTREYEKSGEKRYVTEVRVMPGTEILDWPPKDGQRQQSSQSQQRQQSAPRQQQQQQSQNNQLPPDNWDDDIPF